MKDLVNEGRHLQDNFKDKLIKENPMQLSPIDTLGQKSEMSPSKLDKHYKINHPVLTLLKIESSNKDDSKSYTNHQYIMTMVFGIKASSANTMSNADSLMRDAGKIAKMICDLLDNYNTDHYPGRPTQKGNNITIPIKVTTWTGD